MELRADYVLSEVSRHMDTTVRLTFSGIGAPDGNAHPYSEIILRPKEEQHFEPGQRFHLVLTEFKPDEAGS